MIVRKMHPAEFDDTLVLLDQYFAEAAASLPEMADQWDEESMINFVKTYASQYQYVWLNAYVDNRPVGLIAGCITTAPWNETVLTANIEMIFLEDLHRSMDNFATLVEYFTNWATSLGALKVTAGDIGINPDRTKKIYEHLGFEPACFLVKDIEL
jgi:GNAT superfamily N-acetyltransferase